MQDPRVRHLAKICLDLVVEADYEYLLALEDFDEALGFAATALIEAGEEDWEDFLTRRGVLGSPEEPVGGEVTLGRGALSWPKVEGMSGRRGSVALYVGPESYDSVPLLDLDRPAEGTYGKLKAVVEAVNPKHWTNPEIEREISLGAGRIFFGHEDQPNAVGLFPLDGREDDWLDPTSLYLVQSHTVRLVFEPLPERDDAYGLLPVSVVDRPSKQKQYFLSESGLKVVVLTFIGPEGQTYELLACDLSGQMDLEDFSGRLGSLINQELVGNDTVLIRADRLQDDFQETLYDLVNSRTDAVVIGFYDNATDRYVTVYSEGSEEEGDVIVLP